MTSSHYVQILKKKNTLYTYPGNYTCKIQLCRHKCHKAIPAVTIPVDNETGKTQVLVFLVNIYRVILGLEMTLLNIHVRIQGRHIFLILKRLDLKYGRKSM